MKGSFTDFRSQGFGDVYPSYKTLVWQHIPLALWLLTLLPPGSLDKLPPSLLHQPCSFQPADCLAAMWTHRGQFIFPRPEEHGDPGNLWQGPRPRFNPARSFAVLAFEFINCTFRTEGSIKENSWKRKLHWKDWPYSTSNRADFGCFPCKSPSCANTGYHEIFYQEYTGCLFPRLRKVRLHWSGYSFLIMLLEQAGKLRLLSLIYKTWRVNQTPDQGSFLNWSLCLQAPLLYYSHHARNFSQVPNYSAGTNCVCLLWYLTLGSVHGQEWWRWNTQKCAFPFSLCPEHKLSLLFLLTLSSLAAVHVKANKVSLSRNQGHLILPQTSHQGKGRKDA